MRKWIREYLDTWKYATALFLLAHILGFLGILQFVAIFVKHPPPFMQ